MVATTPAVRNNGAGFLRPIVNLGKALMNDADDTLLLTQEAEHHSHLAPLPVLPEPPEPLSFAAGATGKVWFRSGWTCTCNAEWLPLVELVMLCRGLINESLDIYQLGYSNAVGASAGTHGAGGSSDLGQTTDAQIEVLRWAGGTHQRRTQAQGFDLHVHGWPRSCPHLAPAARAQATQWENRQNGLVSHGPIDGPWPVVDFRTGIRRMEAEMTKFADDIVDRTASRVLAAIANKVWKTDGTIPNSGFTSNTANKDIAAQTALVETFRELGAVRRRQTEQDAKLDAILAKLNGPVA